MKRIWIQRIGAAVLCAVLLAGCMPGGPAADSVKQQIANIKAFVEGRAHG